MSYSRILGLLEHNMSFIGYKHYVNITNLYDYFYGIILNY